MVVYEGAWCFSSKKSHLKVMRWLSADKLLLIGCSKCLRSCFALPKDFRSEYKLCGALKLLVKVLRGAPAVHDQQKVFQN